MEIEYEAVFTNIEPDSFRAVLTSAGAELARAEYMQKRSAFNLPDSVVTHKGWARVRDEGDKITMSVKSIEGEGIESQKESCVTVDSFKQAESLLTQLGCDRKAYQETKRELWMLDGVEVTIDTWPFLEPFVEVEGSSEAVVQAVAEKLGFDWSQAKFCAVDTLYSEKYDISTDQINNHTPEILFDMANPFVK
jgi:adenylate cyclase class 2